jgi:putative FmdB family regulatory protein
MEGNMPIYEFKCTACNNIDEHLMRLSDPLPEGCSACGKPVIKIMSNSTFALKGSGWYVTDYKNKGSSSESTSSS